jgi:hypothetical protein
MRVQGGYNLYGFSVGILMLDTHFPRIPGDIGNATTFPFPVHYHRVQGASPELVVRQGARELLPAFIEGAKFLEREGVRAITTNCSFLAKFQRQLAAAVTVPVFTSSLMLVPIVHRMLPPGKIVGVLSVDASSLTPDDFSGAGITADMPLAIAGLEREKIHSCAAWQSDDPRRRCRTPGTYPGGATALCRASRGRRHRPRMHQYAPVSGRDSGGHGAGCLRYRPPGADGSHRTGAWPATAAGDVGDELR